MIPENYLMIILCIVFVYIVKSACVYLFTSPHTIDSAMAPIVTAAVLFNIRL